MVAPKMRDMTLTCVLFHNLIRQLSFLILLLLSNGVFAQSADVTIDGMGFSWQGKSFNYTGISFFNAIYNPAFNKDREQRKQWLQKFKDNGITVLRIWGQWDNKLGFVDTCTGCTLYEKEGSLNSRHLQTLKEIAEDAASLDMVVLFVLFQRESWNDQIRLADAASEKAVSQLAVELKPHRNIIFQIWNEFDYRVADYYRIIKKEDPARLVTNSPGYGSVLGSPAENRLLDYLSPHTSRDDDKHWQLAEKEVAYLIARYNKPVVDDEPARRGTPDFGGPKIPTSPIDHILHMHNVLKAGGHVIYHHDMFQTGYGTPAVPPSGIPDPDFSPYHRQVFDFLKIKDKYVK